MFQFKSIKAVIGSGALALCLLLGATGSALASAVTDGLKSTIDQVLNVVTDPQYKDDRGARRAKLRRIINPQFNYVEMGKRSLASNWKKLSPKERKAFVILFGKLLENSYASKIEAYQDEKIDYVDEIVKGKYAMVKTTVARKADTVAVNYKLLKSKRGWKVYDFIVEGVSMVRNYRSQFTKIIRKDSFAVLMDKLTKKVHELENGGTNKGESL